MIYCNNCKLEPICNILSSIKKHSAYADIEINRCEFRTNTLENSTFKKNNDIAPTTNEAFVMRSINSDKIQKLSAEKNKIREEENKNIKNNVPILKQEMIAKPLDMNYKCLGCGGNTFEDDRSTCSNCNKDVCSCCATFDTASNNLLCPKCWSEA